MPRLPLPSLLVVAAAGLAALPLLPGRSADAANAPKLTDVLIKDVPHVKQRPDFCGEACVEMWTRAPAMKQPVTQDQVFNLSGLDPALGRGCYTAELTRAVTHLGLKPGPVWHRYATKDAKAKLDEHFAALHADLAAGTPSIVCMHYADKPKTTEHFRLVVGFDARKDEVIYHEPAEDNGAYRRMGRETFLKLWPLTMSASEQVVIRLALPPTKLAEVKATTGFTDADYAQHIMALKERMPKGFHVVLQRPFVVVGDDPPARVQAYAEGTVKWAVNKLKASYFEKDPDEILDVWLFSGKESYDKYTKELFNDEPGTPYGYYSPADKALIMNIATGGGTLVHEIVHPFMAANFSKCPPWFNEGLGSLYEQSAERNGQIIGLTNWRLPGLQKAVKAGNVPSFEKLCAMDNNAFYRQDRGTNYAQARYLCYYLQEKGLLKKYYKDFTANAKDDPGGYKTLQKVLAETDMDAFKTKWEKWVLTLRFP